MRPMLLLALLVPLSMLAKEPPPIPGMTPVTVKNLSFEEGFEKGVPVGWAAYKSASPKRRRELVPTGEGKALKLIDEDDTEEIGIQQLFPVKPKLHYQL